MRPALRCAVLTMTKSGVLGQNALTTARWARLCSSNTCPERCLRPQFTSFGSEFDVVVHFDIADAIVIHKLAYYFHRGHHRANSRCLITGNSSKKPLGILQTLFCRGATKNQYGAVATQQAVTLEPGKPPVRATVPAPPQPFPAGLI